MLYFANPTGEAALDLMRDGVIGFIDTPAQGNHRPPNIFWCADNGCFSSKFREDHWWSFLEANTHDLSLCAFATAPDVVGNAAATLDRSAPWLPRIRALGYPAALVAQNGVEKLSIPWNDFDCLFIGGSPDCPNHGASEFTKTGRGEHERRYCKQCGELMPEWKLSAEASALAREANARGKWTHLGRVNSRRRWKIAEALGYDSADGTFLTRGPKKNIVRLLTWFEP